MNTIINAANYQKWKATYWANDPNGQFTAEMLHALVLPNEQAAFLAQHRRLAGSLKREFATLNALGSKPYTALSAAEYAAFNAACETLQRAFYGAVQANIADVVEYVDGLIRTAHKDTVQ